MVEIAVVFDARCQKIGPLQEAAYRLIGIATCEIKLADGNFECRLNSSAGQLSELDLREKFLNFVTDENLREKISVQTAGTRDVILALAFGVLAAEQSRRS